MLTKGYLNVPKVLKKILPGSYDNLNVRLAFFL